LPCHHSRIARCLQSRPAVTPSGRPCRCTSPPTVP
jgi:hypothetical protein